MSDDAYVSIGQVKRDISQLVNRVAYGNERIVLTSRGAPKAVIISVEDYEKLQASDAQKRQVEWAVWAKRRDALVARILERRGGEMLDPETLWEEFLNDREERDDQILGYGL